MTTTEGIPKWTPSRKSGGSAGKPRSSTSTQRSSTPNPASRQHRSLPKATVSRFGKIASATAQTRPVKASTPTPAGSTPTYGRLTRLCGDCLQNPCPDQRSQAKNGRCRRCTRQLIKASNKREKRKAERADETYVEMYGVQAAAYALGIDGKV